MDRTGTSCSVRTTVPNLLFWSARRSVHRERAGLPGILQLPLLDETYPLLPGEVHELEVPPVLEGADATTGENQKGRDAHDRNEGERQEEDALADEPDREGRVLDGRRGFAELLERCGRVQVHLSSGRDKIDKTLVDKDLTVDQRAAEQGAGQARTASKTSTCVSSTMKASKSKAMMTAASPKTRKAPLKKATRP